MESQTPLEELHLPTRLTRLLGRRGVRFIEDLTTVTRGDLLDIRGLAEKSLEEIESVLAPYGLSLLSEQTGRRAAITALYGSIEGAPLALLLFEHQIWRRLDREGITSLADLREFSESDLRRLAYVYNGNRQVVRARILEDGHIETINSRLSQLGLSLRKD